MKRVFDLETIDSIDFLDYGYFRDDIDYTIKNFQNLGLIPTTRICSCGIHMSLISYKALSDNYVFRCPKCRIKSSLRLGTIFENSKLPLWKIFLFFVATIQFRQITYEQIQNYLHIASPNSIADLKELMRSIVTLIITDKDDKIGGEGVIVQIDECAVSKRKYNVGRLLVNQQYWIVGGIDDNGECFFELTTKRNANILECIIRRNVKDKSTIWTDSWRGYSNLENLGFLHDTVTHKYNFVSETGVHTNRIESTWSAFKRQYRSITNKSVESIQDYIVDFIVKV